MYKGENMVKSEEDLLRLTKDAKKKTLNTQEKFGNIWQKKNVWRKKFEKNTIRKNTIKHKKMRKLTTMKTNS